MIPRILSKAVDQLVIGGNINALEFAYYNSIPIFYDKLEIPSEDDVTKDNVSKRDLLFNYCFLLSLCGLNYSSYNITRYSLSENKLKGYGKLPWILEIEFNKLHDMSSFNLRNDVYKVIDYIDVRSAGYHKVTTIKTIHNFVSELRFYPSKRMNASKKYTPETHDYEKIAKDLMIISYLTPEELENDEYSPMYSRILAKQLMKEHGIEGRVRKKFQDGKIYRHGISLVFNKREVCKLEQHTRNYYYTSTKNKYLERLLKYLYGKK